MRFHLSGLFYNPTERRLRAAFRLAGQAAFFILFSLPLSFLAAWLKIKGFLPEPFFLPASLVMTAISLTASVLLARWRLDHRSFASLGLRWQKRSGLDLLAGFFIAGAAQSLIFLLHLSLGWGAVTGFAWRQADAAQILLNGAACLALFAVVGWQEEIFSRGYHLQNLAEGLNVPLGALLSSLIFALMHLGNPHPSLLAIAGLTLAGLFFCFAFYRSRSLWLPVGLHWGWNFFENTLFGFPVSGLNLFSLVSLKVSGPELFTGGAFGPEAGLALLPGLLLGAGLVWLYSKPNRAHKLPPPKSTVG